MRMNSSTPGATYGGNGRGREAVATRVGPALLLFAAAAFVHPGVAANASSETPEPCSAAWYRSIEKKVPTGDGSGHGPDIGSEEWKSVVEFRLGIRGEPDVPSRDSEDWCHHIDRLVIAAQTSSGADADAERASKGPSFDCAGVEAGSIEAVICGDDALATLDRKLADVYAAASKKAVNEHPPALKVEQRGWIKGRNECWKADDRRACVKREYERRIAELQARYRLVSHRGPVRFVCDDNPASEVSATFFRTEPPTLIAERRDSLSFMVLQPSGSGSKYQGGNETFWEHQGEALITWGFEASEMRCLRKP